MRSPQQKAQFEYVVAAYDAAVGKYMSLGLQALTEQEKTVCLVWIVDAEVNNGGFDQYFFNSSGDASEEAVTALELVGAPRAAALMRRARALFPDGTPSANRHHRQNQLDALRGGDESPFEDLDSGWYREIEDLEALLAKYLREGRNG